MQRAHVARRSRAFVQRGEKIAKETSVWSDVRRKQEASTYFRDKRGRFREWTFGDKRSRLNSETLFRSIDSARTRAAFCPSPEQ